jgi:hypothetical protein
MVAGAGSMPIGVLGVSRMHHSAREHSTEQNGTQPECRYERRRGRPQSRCGPLNGRGKKVVQGRSPKW